ncbi:MAG: CpsD/CapB family tyrosine-protein kinase [Oscillospiraceae bacterium]
MIKRKNTTDVNCKLNSQTPFHIAEAYKTIRTNLLFSLATQKNNIVVFSSAMPGEGKSTTCSNLAIAMAQTEAKVLLIDADLRKPTQYKIFKRNNSRGLSTLLVGFDTFEKCLQKDISENLDLICSGPLPPNPSELLSSENMRILLKKLQLEYDYIFIDTPPINIVTDAMTLAGKSAGIVLISRSEQSTYDELSKAVTSIEFAGSDILGIIVTDLKHSTFKYGNYKYKEKYEYK